MMLSKLPLNISCSNRFSEDYDLKEKIGEGTFSNVWLCVRRISGQKAAAKVLKNNYEHTVFEDTWNDISEINVADLLQKHPFLLMVEKAYYEKQKIILITELMKKSLYDILKEAKGCPLPEHRIKTYMYQMLEGKYCVSVIKWISLFTIMFFRFKIFASKWLYSPGY